MSANNFTKQVVFILGFASITGSVFAQKIILAKVELKEQTEASFYDQTVDLIALTRKEDGCLSFYIQRESENPNILVIHEIFVDENAFKQHLKKPYVIDWFRQLDRVKASAIEIVNLKPLK